MNSRSSGRTFRAEVGGHSIDLEFRADDLVIDGKPYPLSAVRMSEDQVSLLIGDRSRSMRVYPDGKGRYLVHLAGRVLDVTLKDETALLLERFGFAGEAQEGRHEIRAPMPGLVLSLHAEIGAVVESGDPILVLEAMKMENELLAPAAGTVTAVHVATGDAVGKSDLLLEIEA